MRCRLATCRGRPSIRIMVKPVAFATWQGCVVVHGTGPTGGRRRGPSRGLRSWPRPARGGAGQRATARQSRRASSPIGPDTETTGIDSESPRRPMLRSIPPNRVNCAPGIGPTGRPLLWFSVSLVLTTVPGLNSYSRGSNPCAIGYERRSRCTFQQDLMREGRPEMATYRVKTAWIASRTQGTSLDV